MAAPDWHAQAPQKSLNGLVAVPWAKTFVVEAGDVASLSWENLTRSVQIVADGVVYLGLSQAGVAGTNYYPLAADAPFAEVFQANALYIRNPGEDAVTVSAWVVLSDMVVTGTDPAFALSSARGFDGVTTAVALTNPVE